MAEVKITKNKVIPFIDTSGTINTESWAPTWKQIDKSTIFDLAFNPQSESIDYICYEAAVEEISSYQPELPQEIALLRGNPIYDFVENLCINLPVGDSVRVPALICWPPKPKDPSGEEIKAWQVKLSMENVENRVAMIEREPGEKWKKIVFEVIKYVVLAAAGAAIGYIIK